MLNVIKLNVIHILPFISLYSNVSFPILFHFAKCAPSFDHLRKIILASNQIRCENKFRVIYRSLFAEHIYRTIIMSQTN